MLDTATKKRIDDCRDILVGKLPDPKAQIEQITIGLIYKFMDDMDKEAIELGGKAKFFSGAYKKYSWDSLFDTRVTATEMLRLYSEAITSMDKNPNIPQLFRDIFKNAFLPYRDPETLKMFLRTISEFEYTHSEKLGDAFEYLLSVMGSQGDAGQFRTPRHIIDFLVAIVDPQKGDTILDPACGTAGFLISAFKHIREKNNHELTPVERKNLIRNFTGYDISPDMVRLSLVNLYLHGFSDPHIYEYDTLSSEERWKDNYDVILANPPFMSPKGGIRPHKKFSISSNRSEVLFVDYIAEHLNPNGKAGIIVPEGVIFQSGTAYKDLRKMLVENYLYAVVSLPAGIFNPYSGVKTSILLMDREVAKKSNEILFVKIDNDGFNLGAQRNAIKGGQLGNATKIIHDFNAYGKYPSADIAHAVKKSVIAKSGDYNLSGERYKTVMNRGSNYPLKKIEEVCTINPLKSEIQKLAKSIMVSFVPMSDINENSIDFEVKQTKSLEEVYNGYTYFRDNDVLIAKVTPCFENGKAGLAKNLTNSIGFGSSEYYVLRCSDSIKPEYLFRILKSPLFYDYAIPKMTGTGGLRRVPKNVLSEFDIPVPPLSIQAEIVAEIEGYQKIIDGAKMVVENYKPKIDVDPEWEMMELGEVCDIKAGGTPLRSIHKYWEGNIPWYSSGELNDLYTSDPYEYITSEGLKNSNATIFPKGSLLIGMYDTAAFKMSILDRNATFNQAVCGVKPNPSFDLYFLMLYFIMNKEEYLRHRVGVRQRNLNKGFISEILIPKIPLIVQHQIVAKIEKEQVLIEANKQLIEIFEQKIKDRIGKVWGELPVVNKVKGKKTKALSEVTEG
ncbi:MAG TPA: N-6 DNA methylase [Saprospiraceae bacterium]|nr:N-6 DNA methylase [Saprospiraceae bacterium]